MSPDSVLVGTKCNSLLLLDALTGRNRRVPLPPKPAVRLGPELMHNPDGHCGMHAMDVSPDGRYVVTGGRAAEDVLVLWRDTLAPVRTFSVSGGGLVGGVGTEARSCQAAVSGGQPPGSVVLWELIQTALALASRQQLVSWLASPRLEPLRMCSRRSCASFKQQSHADWVFGLSWVTETHFVSCECSTERPRSAPAF